jgi:thioredoxin 1
MVTELTDDNFQDEVLNSDIPCLIDFYAPWCGPCADMAPRFEELSKRYEGKVKFCRADSDANKRLRIAFLVAALPYLVYVDGGKKSPLFDESVPMERLAERIDMMLEGGEAPTTSPLVWR